MIYIGIDPGKSGGVAILFETGSYEVKPFSEQALIQLLSVCAVTDSIACVEKVNAMPGQGVVSMFNFGKNAGFIEGVLQTLKIPYQLVPPQTWKKEFTLTSNKQSSIDVCRKLFPSVELLATERSRKEHDGMAEALLMAEYARRKL